MKNIESIKGRVRCYLKSKVRITTALVVSFLITGSLSYSGSLAEILVDGESVQTLDSDNWTYTLEKGKNAKQIKIATDGYKGTFTNNGVVELTQEDTGSYHNAIEIDQRALIVNNGDILVQYKGENLSAPTRSYLDSYLNGIGYSTVNGDIENNKSIEIDVNIINDGEDILNTANGIFSLSGYGKSRSIPDEEPVSIKNTGVISSKLIVENNRRLGDIELSGNGIIGRGSLENLGSIYGYLETKDESIEEVGDENREKISNPMVEFSGLGVFDLYRDENLAVNINKGSIKGEIISSGQDTEATGIGIIKAGKIENYGVISGQANIFSQNSINSDSGWGGYFIGGFLNRGKISGSLSSNFNIEESENSGNGLCSPNMGLGVNSGFISGFVSAPEFYDLNNSGNGILYFDYEHNLETKIMNRGTVKGGAFYDTINRISNSGYGMSFEENFNRDSSGERGTRFYAVEENKGTIMGTHGSVNGFVNKNYGLLVGKKQDYLTFRSTREIADSSTNYIETNKGIDVIIDESQEVTKINSSENIEGSGVYNTDRREGLIDSYETFTQNKLDGIGRLESGEIIINGVGKESGVITTGEDLGITNTIVNSYYSALTINDGHTVTATNSIFNGGGLGTLNNNGTEEVFDDFIEYLPIITGDSGSNTFIAKGETIINGNIDLGDGSDTVTLYENVIVNGNIDGSSSGEDIINIGVKEPQIARMARSFALMDTTTTVSNTNIFGSVSNFENVNIDGDVTFFEEASLVGGKTINISDGSNLNIRIDGSKKDSSGSVSGHALYLFDGDIDFENTDGKLTLTPYNFGSGSILGFKDTSGISVLRGSVSNIDVSSFLYGAEVEKGGLINIHLRSSLDIDSRLNKIYEGISTGSDENIDKFNEITGGEESSVVSTLSQIYRATPGTYSPYISKVSSDLFTSTVITNAGMVEKDRWKVYGGAYGGRSEDDSTMSLGDIKRDTSVFGGYGLAEYGIDHGLAIGFAVGGNTSDTNIDGGSDLDGNSLNLGVYNKYIYKNYSFTSGISYQYTSFDSTRKLNGLEFKDTYDTNTFSVYTEGRYSYELGDTLKLEPNLQLRYTYVDQGSIDEGTDSLALNVDSDQFNYVDVKPALDLVKIIPVSNGFVELTTGIAYNLVYGDDSSSNMTGSFNSGSDFDLYIGDIDDTFEVKVRAEHQINTGLYYDIEVKYRAGDDLNEYLGEVGMGYRF